MSDNPRSTLMVISVEEPRPRILVADDDGVTRKLLVATLTRWGYDVQSVRDGEEAWRVLSGEDAPSLAILDWVMPGLDGLAICERLRALRGPYIYVLLLSARSETIDLVRGLDAGADDYIIKPFDLNELNARLRVGKRILRLERDLRDRASRDPLTGIWSRRSILELLPQELERARRNSMSLAIAFADLDHFKRINDSFGHLVGDAVLQEATRRFSTVLRPYDHLGRYGGEELLFIFPQCDVSNASRVAERVRLALCSAPIDALGQRVEASVSIGVCVAGPREASAWGVLLKNADLALYRAKSAGRNRVEVHAPEHP